MMNYKNTNKKVGRVARATYPVRSAWNETHTVERTSIRHARIAKRKNTRETVFYAILDLAMVAFILFHPMFI